LRTHVVSHQHIAVKRGQRPVETSTFRPTRQIVRLFKRVRIYTQKQHVVFVVGVERLQMQCSQW